MLFKGRVHSKVKASLLSTHTQFHADGKPDELFRAREAKDNSSSVIQVYGSPEIQKLIYKVIMLLLSLLLLLL